MGSLLVWDLREKPRCPRTGDAEALNTGPDPDIAHFAGPIWHVSVFSTDVFAFSSAVTANRNEEEMSGSKARQGASLDSGGVHCVEICSIRCSDTVGADALIFALDIMGVVS